MAQSTVTLENPFTSRFLRTRQAGPFVMVIFGASGDLTRRKLVPALFSLYREGYLKAPFCILGMARSEMSDADFQQRMSDAVGAFARVKPDSDEQLRSFVAHLHYVTGSFGDMAAYDRLRERVHDCARRMQIPHNTLFYLATPPGAFADIIGHLRQARLVTPVAAGENWTRIIIEKPFGHDTPSARALNDTLHDVFAESQVYRIDHYLGKETVQNILVFRLGNSIFEPLWNRRYVDNVQISVAESIGIGSRAGYFDRAGIIRDMIQSHIMQVFTLTAMEPPASFEANAIRDEKVKVLKSLRPITPGELPQRVVRAQYTAGWVGGKRVKGYLEEDGVPPDSRTDTYVALRVDIDNWRWAGVPFYLRAGKRLPKRVTEVTITFKEPPHLIFHLPEGQKLTPNVLRLRIQPQEGVSLTVGVKLPGQAETVTPVRMDFTYATAFGIPSPEAYERLILDAITGDSTLFAREDEVELAWEYIDRITTAWQELPLHTYPAGEWGPAAADTLLENDRRCWHRL